MPMNLQDFTLFISRVPIDSPRTIRRMLNLPHTELVARRQKFATNSNVRFSSAANLICDLLQEFYPYDTQSEKVQGPPSKKHKYERVDDRILEVVLNYQNGIAIEYLRGIAHNL